MKHDLNKKFWKWIAYIFLYVPLVVFCGIELIGLVIAHVAFYGLLYLMYVVLIVALGPVLHSMFKEWYEQSAGEKDVKKKCCRSSKGTDATRKSGCAGSCGC